MKSGSKTKKAAGLKNPAASQEVIWRWCYVRAPQRPQVVICFVTYMVLKHPVAAELPSHADFMRSRFAPAPKWLRSNAGFMPAKARTESVATADDTARP